MINREDMLELTRRMTPTRSSITRMAGAYMDEEGFVDGSFNIHFLKLSLAERGKNLEVAKAIPFSKTNEQLVECSMAGESPEVWRLLEAIRREGLKNDALMDSLYEWIGEHYESNHNYGIFVFHDRYDVPLKGTDKERQGESEEVYEYLILSIAPVDGDYEIGEPEYGFLYPAFKDRSCDLDHVLVFRRDRQFFQPKLEKKLFGAIIG